MKFVVASVLCGLALGVLGLAEVSRARYERRFISGLSKRIVGESGATGPRGEAEALRDYLRAHVGNRGVDAARRPWLRDSAAETLQTNKGFCGEVSRAFIWLAAARGIPDRRIYLFGRQEHVVAEAWIPGPGWVLVDSQSPPLIPEFVSLDKGLGDGGFSGFSYLTLGRLGGGAGARWRRPLPMAVGLLIEDPALLRAAAWLAGAALAGTLAAVLGARCRVRPGPKAGG